MSLRLDDLVQATRDSLARRKRERPMSQLEHELAARGEGRPFQEALSHPGTSLIAEHKRRSPSAGVIREGATVTDMVQAYERGGAAAISVLTEEVHFGGSLDDLRAVRAVVERPVLRKDFLVHPDQVLEARAVGADAVLLIASCLDDDELATMLTVARELGMEPLVETHTDEDLERVLATDADVVGVNARDLESLDVDVAAALGRVGRIGRDRVAVFESGIGDRADVVAAVEAGASAILVGESLMRAADPSEAVRWLIHGKELRR
jgi:indole-3-glycerol phosphate synthase